MTIKGMSDHLSLVEAYTLLLQQLCAKQHIFMKLFKKELALLTTFYVQSKMKHILLKRQSLTLI